MKHEEILFEIATSGDLRAKIVDENPTIFLIPGTAIKFLNFENRHLIPNLAVGLMCEKKELEEEELINSVNEFAKEFY